LEFFKDGVCMIKFINIKIFILTFLLLSSFSNFAIAQSMTDHQKKEQARNLLLEGFKVAKLANKASLDSEEKEEIQDKVVDYIADHTENDGDFDDSIKHISREARKPRTRAEHEEHVEECEVCNPFHEFLLSDLDIDPIPWNPDNLCDYRRLSTYINCPPPIMPRSANYCVVSYNPPAGCPMGIPMYIGSVCQCSAWPLVNGIAQ